MQILGLICMYFDDAAVEVKKNLLLFRFPPAIPCERSMNNFWCTVFEFMKISFITIGQYYVKKHLCAPAA